MDCTIQINDEFLKDRPLSYSSLKEFWKSPAHYIDYITKPKTISDAMILGQVVECLVFDEKIFQDKFEVYQKFPKRSNADKEKWQLMCESAKDNKITLVDNDMYANAVIMAESVKNTPETSYYIDKVLSIQKKLSWTDKKTKLPIIGYVDVECEIDENLIIIDFKTSQSSNPDEFMKNAAKFGYELQVGAYLTGYHKQHYKFPDFMFMVVESSPPYNATMIHCPGDYCEYAKDEFDHMLTAFRYCMDKNEFHRGYHFWNAEMPYFNMEKPRWKKQKYMHDK